MIVYALRDSYTERLHSQPQLAFSFRELCRTLYNSFTNDKGELLPKKTYQYLEVVYISFLDESGKSFSQPDDLPETVSMDEEGLVYADGLYIHSHVVDLIEHHKTLNNLV